MVKAGEEKVLSIITEKLLVKAESKQVSKKMKQI